MYFLLIFLKILVVVVGMRWNHGDEKKSAYMEIP